MPITTHKKNQIQNKTIINVTDFNFSNFLSSKSWNSSLFSVIFYVKLSYPPDYSFLGLLNCITLASFSLITKNPSTVCKASMRLNISTSTQRFPISQFNLSPSKRNLVLAQLIKYLKPIPSIFEVSISVTWIFQKATVHPLL